MKRSERLKILSELVKLAESDGYGGKGPFELPIDHVAAMVSPAGFSCATCKWVDEANHSCNSSYYIKWNGGDRKLPDAPLHTICSDFFEPKA